ncbi:MAG TPA: hypothetical protein VGN97_19635 [Mesorhizobium sp.]|nr:hypothetical protein [Mesorhizobium sp.]
MPDIGRQDGEIVHLCCRGVKPRSPAFDEHLNDPTEGGTNRRRIADGDGLRVCSTQDVAHRADGGT